MNKKFQRFLGWSILFVGPSIRKEFLDVRLEIVVNFLLLGLAIYLLRLDKKEKEIQKAIFKKYKPLIVIVTIATLIVYFYISLNLK